MEGSISQILVICPSFCFMKPRQKLLKNTLKVKNKSEKKKIKIYVSKNQSLFNIYLYEQIGEIVSFYLVYNTSKSK